MKEYYINLARTVAYEVEEQIIKTVRFDKIQLGNVDEVHSELLMRKVGEQELVNIRASNYPCTLIDFEEVFTKSILYHIKTAFPKYDEETENVTIAFFKKK